MVQAQDLIAIGHQSSASGKLEQFFVRTGHLVNAYDHVISFTPRPSERICGRSWLP